MDSDTYVDLDRESSMHGRLDNKVFCKLCTTNSSISLVIHIGNGGEKMLFSAWFPTDFAEKVYPL